MKKNYIHLFLFCSMILGAISLNAQYLAPAGWTATASTVSSTWTVGSFPANLFDNDNSTFWHSNGSNNAMEHFIVDMKNPVNVQGVEYRGRAGGMNNVIHYRVEVSVDGSTWTLAAEGARSMTTEPGCLDDTYQVIDFAEEKTGVQFIKFSSTGPNCAGSPNFVVVGDFRVKGCYSPNPKAYFTYSVDPFTNKVTFTNASAPVCGQTATYLWTFTTGGIGTISVEEHPVHEFSNGEHLVTLTVTSNGETDTYSESFNLKRRLPLAGWTATFSDAYYNIRGNIFDDNNTTIWHSACSNAGSHHLIINTQLPVNLDGFSFRGRSNALNNIKSYRLEVSQDGNNWTNVSEGTLSDCGGTGYKYIGFAMQNDIQYIKLSSTGTSCSGTPSCVVVGDILAFGTPGPKGLLADFNTTVSCNLVSIVDQAVGLNGATVDPTRTEWEFDVEDAGATPGTATPATHTGALGDVSVVYSQAGTYTIRQKVFSSEGFLTNTKEATVQITNATPSLNPAYTVSIAGLQATFQNATTTCGTANFDPSKTVWKFKAIEDSYLSGTASPAEYVGATPPAVNYSLPGTYPVTMVLYDATNNEVAKVDRWIDVYQPSQLTCNTLPAGTTATVNATATQSGDNAGAPALIDGDTDTYWHTPWWPVLAPPHWFTLDFGSVQNDIVALQLKSRNTYSKDGRPLLYNVYKSDNGTDWQFMKTGIVAWPDAGGVQTTYVPLPKINTQYLKFEALQMTGGVAFLNLSEATICTTTESWTVNLASIQNFEVEALGKTVQLSWNILKENTIQVVEVQKNIQNEWKTIANVYPNGSGNYTYLDNDMLSLNQYRLKVVSAEGKVSYSAIKVLAIGATANKGVAIYPNPVVSGVLKVTNAGTAPITIMSMNGQKVLATVGTGAETTIDVSKLSKGMYILLVNSEGFKFIIK